MLLKPNLHNGKGNLFRLHHQQAPSFSGFPLVAGTGGDPRPTSQNFDKSPLTKILSLPINVCLDLVWHSFPSISQAPPPYNLVYINNYII